MRELTLIEIMKFLGNSCSVHLLGKTSLRYSVKGVGSLERAGARKISFCGKTARNPKILLARSKTGAIIVDKDLPVDMAALENNGVKAIIISDNARLDFIRVVSHFFVAAPPKGIDESSLVKSSAIIGKNVFIGPSCTIGENVIIGTGSQIHAGVHVYDGVIIGRNVTIQAGAVLGGEGVGYERDKRGCLQRFHHFAKLVIEDDVKVGPNSVVARGVLTDTTIGKGSKLGAHVNIEHNVRCGRHVMIGSGVGVCGSVVIGDFCWIAPGAVIRDRCEIGPRSFLGLGCVVTKDVPKNSMVMGIPARQIEEQKRRMEAVSRLLL